MSGSEAVVLQERLGPVAHVILNRPAKLNAADREMQMSIVQVLRASAQAEGVHALVVSGRGRALSAGGDRQILNEILEGNRDDSLGAIMGDLQWSVLHDIHQPVVLAVSGFAIGWGAGLVALADFIVMEEDAYIQDPHSSYGLNADPSCEMVWSRFMPPAVLKEALLFGRRISAGEAHRWGLVNWVVPTGTATDVALNIAGRLSDISPQAVAAIKEGVNRETVRALERQRPQPSATLPMTE